MGYFESIYADTELPHRCKTVYIYLRDRANASGSCWPGIKTIASDLGLSRSTVKRAINELERKGFLLKNVCVKTVGDLSVKNASAKL